MDITDFVFSRRQDAFLIGNYNTYRTQCSRRLHTLWKKLGLATPKGRKYVAKPPVSVENVGNNVAYLHLLLLSSERAWANAMHMKSAYSGNSSAKGVVGSTRRHIFTRLNKAISYARQLVLVLQDPSASGASPVDLLEARGYLAMLSGALWMEKHKWEDCLRCYSTSRVIYSILGQKMKKDSFRDLISGTVDPSLRYAAYQMRLPRSKPLPSLAIQFFSADADIRSEIESVDPASLTEEAVGARMVVDGGVVQPLPEHITWRSHTVVLEDASIAQALAATSSAEARLTSWLLDSARRSASPKEKAIAYENVILASQDAVDATKAAIDELNSEGLDPGDQRMQALQIARTAVNYTLLSWRVGRNRVLCGERDGLVFEVGLVPASKKSFAGTKSRRYKAEGRGKKLARLRERVALYDATLQSLDSVQELPGVAGDVAFVRELEGKRHYFRALRCVAIGLSHSFTGKPENALALYVRASDLALAAKAAIAPQAVAQGPPALDVSPEQVNALGSAVRGLVAQYRGLVTLERLSASQEEKTDHQAPLIQRMDDYSGDNVDLRNLAPYPPKIQPIPIKPLFLDVAWNYVSYPRDSEAQPEHPTAVEENKEVRRGWFGFGR